MKIEAIFYQNHTDYAFIFNLNVLINGLYSVQFHVDITGSNNLKIMQQNWIVVIYLMVYHTGK